MVKELSERLVKSGNEVTVYCHRKLFNKKPKKVLNDSNLEKAFNIMKKNSIWDLPVVDKNNKLKGMLHLHPIVKFFLNK